MEGQDGFSNTRAVYTTSWAGAMLEADPANGFLSVTASFVVPKPSVPSTANSSVAQRVHYASAWVGIDGGSACPGALLQAGLILASTRQLTPDESRDLNITIVTGNIVKLTATADSSTSGTITVQNVSQNQTVTRSLNSTEALCQRNAAWMVENFSIDGTATPFANFSSITFTDASATTFDGKTKLSPVNSTLMDISWEGDIVTNTTVAANGNVLVQYLG
ncbi:peptidase G1 [Auriculariales sp. MPI-PUGE-AT-0066]|nr:peptidase G1 [Auriculariales sp. MPI-PUGE-AT-0066]